MAGPDPRELALAGLMLRPKPDQSAREQGDDQQLDHAPLSAPDTLTDVTASMHDIVGNSLVNAALTGAADTGLEHSIAATMGGAVAGLGGWAESGFSSNTMMRQALHRHAAGPAPSAPKLNKGGGRPLPDDVRVRMEAAMGRDLSHVRIHTDGAAQARSKDIHAHAFTVGSDIYFGSGEFQPGTEQGDRLLGHELTHVIQHDEGRMRLPDRDRSVSLPTDPTEVEAYANEKRVLSELQRVDTAIADGLPMGESTPLMGAERIGEVVSDFSGGMPDGGGLSEVAAGGPPAGAGSLAAMSRAEQEEEDRPVSMPPDEEQLIGQVPKSEEEQQAGQENTDKKASPGDEDAAGAAGQGGSAVAEGVPASVAAVPGVPAAVSGAVADAAGAAPVLGVMAGPDLLATVPTSADLSTVGAELSAFAPTVGGTPAPTGSAQRNAEGIGQKADGMAEQLAATGAGVMGAIEARVGQAVGQITTLHDQIAGQVASAFDSQIAAVHAQQEAAAAAIASAQAQQRTALTAQAEAQRTRVRTELENCRVVGEQSGTQTASAIVQMGEQEAERAIAESEVRAVRALSLGSEVSAGGDKACADAQQESATKIGKKAAEKCRDTGAQVAVEIRSAAAEMAAQVEQKRDAYLSSLDQGVAQVDGHINELEQRGLAQVDGVASQGIAAVQSLSAEGVGGLENGRAQAVAALAAMRDQASAQFEQAGLVLTEQMQPQIEEIQQMFRAYGASAMSQLTAMEGGDAMQIDGARQNCVLQLDQQYATTNESFAQLSDASLEELSQLLTAVSNEMTGAGSQAAADADAIGAGIVGRISEASSGVVGALATTVSETIATMRSGVDELVQQLTEKRQEYETGIRGLEDEARVGMADAIAQGLAKEDEFVEEARGEAERATQEISSEYASLQSEANARKGEEGTSRSWLGDAWNSVTSAVSSLVAKVQAWFLKTFGDFWGGLLFGILQGLVVIAIGLVFIKVVALVAGALAISAKAAAIVTVCVALAAGIGFGIYARFQEFYADNPGQDAGVWRGLALVGLGIADLTGIPFMVEAIVGQRAFGAKMTTAQRTERFGMGLVFMGAGILGGIRAWRGRGNAPKTPADGPDARQSVPKDGPDAQRPAPKDGPDAQRPAPKDGPDGQRSTPKDGPDAQRPAPKERGTTGKNKKTGSKSKTAAEWKALYDSEFSQLATAEGPQSPTPWQGKNPGRGAMSETLHPRPIPRDKVVAEWRRFLGEGPYNNKHPRTGATETTRVVSADGKRSIRYGNHERTGKPTKHHYHEETWTYDADANVITVDNRVMRVPLPKPKKP